MNREEYLKTVRKQIRFVFDRDSIEQEMRQHLDDSIADWMEEGFSREDAERIAVEQMGDAKEVGKMLNKEHHPVLGYLWMISRIVLILVAIPALYLGIYGGYKSLRLLTPTVVEDSTETYQVGIEYHISTHKVKLDNICRKEDGTYCLTYRAWTKWDYSRAGWSTDFFYFIDENGDRRLGGGYCSSGIGGYEGYKEFEWPEDNILRLVDRDGDEIEIDLEEYCDETK